MGKKILKYIGPIIYIVVSSFIFAILFIRVVPIFVERVSANAVIDSYLKEEKYYELIDYADSKLKSSSSPFDLLSNKGYALIMTGESGKALITLNEALELKPDSDVVLNNLSWAYNNLGMYEKALEFSSRALKIHPNDEFALINKGDALLELERYDEALEAYSNAININSKYDLAYYGRGLAYYYMGKYEEAIVELKECLRLSPDDVDFTIYLGQAYMYAGYNEKAIAEFDALIDLIPEDPIAVLLKGQALAGEGRYGEAKLYYERALKLDPNYSDAYLYLGISSYNQKKYNEALEYMDKSIEVYQGYTVPYVWKGKIYIELKEYSKALEFCNKAITMNPKDPFAYNIKGITYYRQGHLEEALDTVNKAISANASDEDTYILKAGILLEQDDYLDGISFIDNALGLFPHSFDLIWYKADMLSCLLRHEEAALLYEKVLKYDRKNNDILLSLAWEYYYNQDYDKALEYLKSVEKLDSYASEIELLNKFLEEANIPEAQKIVRFVRDNYLYIKEVKDFEKKAKLFEGKREVSIDDIKGFLDSVIVKKDKFSFIVYGKEYEELYNIDYNLHIIERRISSQVNYIMVPAFTENMGIELINKVDEIKDPENINLIIDLRNNTGGAINSANVILDYFLGNTITTSLIDRKGQVKNYKSDMNQVKFKKIIIFVNENSASSSEILTLGLKKHLNNITVIGCPTFGKEVGQQIFENKKKNMRYLLPVLIGRLKMKI